MWTQGFPDLWSTCGGRLSTTHKGAFCCLAFLSVTVLLAELAVLWFYYTTILLAKGWNREFLFVFLASVSESVENRCAFGLFISWNAINQALETKIFQQVGQTTPCSPSASDLTDVESISLRMSYFTPAWRTRVAVVKDFEYFKYVTE